MQSMTIRIPDDLMAWLEQQAQVNDRSKNKQIERLIREARDRQNYISNAKKAARQ